MVPSGLRSTITSRGPSRTARSGGAEAGSWRSGQRSLTDVDVAMAAPSGAHRLRRPFLEEGLEPRLGLVVALGDGGDQRLREIAGRRILLRDPRQHVSNGKIGHGRIAGDTLSELDALVEAGMERDHVV